MGITSEVDSARRLILSRAEGTLSDSDIIEFTEWVWSDPERGAYDKLLDLRGVERIDVTPEGIRTAAAIVPRMRPGARTYRVALVAKANAVYALSRMYEMLRTKSRGEVRVFRDIDDARAWLDVG